MWRYVTELMMFAFVRTFVGGNQVCIELRENCLDGWGRWLMEKGAAGEVSVTVEGDESGSVVVENLHGGGSAAVIVTVCYSDFYVKSVQANCVRSVVAVTNFISVKLFKRVYNNIRKEYEHLLKSPHCKRLDITASG